MNDEKKNYTAVEAERAVIGAILLDNHAIYEAGPLDKKYFSDSRLWHDPRGDPAGDSWRGEGRPDHRL